MEIWDAYKKDGSLAGCDLYRNKPIPEGLYHIVSEVLVKHIDGTYLIMQRDFNKKYYPGQFEAGASGSIQKGETIAYKWMRKEDLMNFVNSNEYVQAKRDRWLPFLNRI